MNFFSRFIWLKWVKVFKINDNNCYNCFKLYNNIKYFNKGFVLV